MAKPKRKTVKIKSLRAKSVGSSQARHVKGGYIGETEKLKGAAKKG